MAEINGLILWRGYIRVQYIIFSLGDINRSYKCPHLTLSPQMWDNRNAYEYMYCTFVLYEHKINMFIVEQ